MTTTIIIPCRNEAGHLATLVETIIPYLKTHDDILLIEGNSNDDTFEVASKLSDKNPSKVQILKQPGKGKFNAVYFGVTKSQADDIMVWDADGTVALEDNLSIYKSHLRNSEILTGNRLSGSRERGAMRFANLCGNFLFGIAWGWIFKQKPFDSLCGSKKFPRSLIADAPMNMVKADPFGDFTILALANRKSMTVQHFPVKYSARVYGETNIKRWSSGVILLKFLILFRLDKI